jgi:hypothetical protein
MDPPPDTESKDRKSTFSRNVEYWCKVTLDQYRQIFIRQKMS